MVRLLVVVGWALMLSVAVNVAWQRCYCHEPWVGVRLFAEFPCEPIEAIARQQAELRLMACQHPYSEEVNDPCRK